MTLRTLLKATGITFVDKDVKLIGHTISQLAIKRGVKRFKVVERHEKYKVMVNDYPDSFVPVMQQEIITYFTTTREKVTS